MNLPFRRKKNSVLFEFSVPESKIGFFDYSFSAEKGTSKGAMHRTRHSVKAHRYDDGWDKAETLKSTMRDSPGGFGASRPYPDVMFSRRTYGFVGR